MSIRQTLAANLSLAVKIASSGQAEKHITGRRPIRLVLSENSKQEVQAVATEEGGFDLIVLSEVAYYWADDDLDLAAAAITRLLAPRGDLLLVHWTGETDYSQSGDGEVQKLSTALKDVEVILAERHDHYRLDLWRRRR